MNLKHSTKVSSLDALGMSHNSSKFSLYKEISIVNIDGVECIMIPYHQDQTMIRKWMLENYPTVEQDGQGVSDKIGFCHMAIHGAIERLQKDNKKTFIRRVNDSGVPKYLLKFKRGKRPKNC